MRDPPSDAKRRRSDKDGGALQEERPKVTYVYMGCPPRNLTRLEVDPSVRRIEDMAFRAYTCLQSASISPTVDYIGVEAFEWCESLSELQLHRGLTHIASSAFSSCKSLIRVRLPEGLHILGSKAFRDCTSLVEIDLPNGITGIAEATFEYCKSLRTVFIPATVEEICRRAFARCVSLVDVSLPTMLKRIEEEAFKGCKKLSSVVFPESLVHIGCSAFFACEELLAVEFPASSSSCNIRLGPGEFNFCNSLVNVSIPTSMSDHETFEGGKFSSDKMECLIDRFSNLPVHNLCYHSSLATRDQMIRILNDSSTENLLDESMLKDAFGMTPFHVLASSAGLSLEILECLLERYPMTILFEKDDFGRTMLDYLVCLHRSPRAVPLLQMVLGRTIVDRVSLWHPQGDWGTNLSMLVESIHQNAEPIRRCGGIQNSLQRLGYYCRMETTSLIELAVWKTKMRSSMQDLKPSKNDETTMDTRESCRYNSGAGIVIENVMGYLWKGEGTWCTGLSLCPLI